MNKHILIFLILIFTIGCEKQKYSIKPDSLPNAHIGKPYKQEPHITGGKIIPYTFQIHHNLKKDIGITIKPFEDQEGILYNHLNIEGTPKYKGNYHIKITG